MTDFLSRFDFDEFRVLNASELEAIRAKLDRQPKQIRGERGKDGRDAIVDYNVLSDNIAKIRIGKEGPRGEQGIQGREGPRGPKGDQGEQGPIPDHRWEGTKLSFQLPSGEFEEPVDLQGPPGKAGTAGVAAIGGGILTIAQNTYFPSGW